jgi:hypothetical protein
MVMRTFSRGLRHNYERSRNDNEKAAIAAGLRGVEQQASDVGEWCQGYAGNEIDIGTPMGRMRAPCRRCQIRAHIVKLTAPDMRDPANLVRDGVHEVNRFSWRTKLRT